MTTATLEMKPCKFTFDDDKVYDGFSHGSTWNGFDNVAVDKATRDKLIADLETNNATSDEIEQFREITQMENGLYSLGWGFATTIVRPDKPAEEMNLLEKAIRNDDMHEAIGQLQNALGIKYGDVAAQVLDIYDDIEAEWAKGPIARRNILTKWLTGELIFGVP